MLSCKVPKKFAGVLAGILILVGACTAVHAGVVVDEQRVVDSGKGKPITQSMVEIIQGNKRKIIAGKQATVTDLDRNILIIMNLERKAYIQMPLPTVSLTASALVPKFQKTDGHETIAGYPCDDYTMAANVGGNTSKIAGCFSTSAPGASDFTAFNQLLAEKAKGTLLSPFADFPAGVPLKLDITTKIAHISLPAGKFSPEQSEQIQQLLAKSPPIVTRIIVTKITPQKLPPDAFRPPIDYKQEKPPTTGPGIGVGGQRPVGKGMN